MGHDVIQFESKFDPICIQKFSFTKKSSLILFFSLNMSLETAFRIESDMGFACQLANNKPLTSQFYGSKLQKTLILTKFGLQYL